MKIGFIGTGNMGGALARAAVRTGKDYELLLANRTVEKAFELAAETGGLAKVTDNEEIAAEAEYIFLGVKPQMMAEMMAGIAPILKKRSDAAEHFVLISMAAGLSIERIRELAGGDYDVIRIMPNTPAAIGEGMILYAAPGVSAADIKAFREMMSEAGRLSELPEQLIDAGSAVSGCGPAFVYMFIEALADGGVLAGLPRAKAYELAEQTLIGSAKLLMSGKSHPGELKDAVCSPGGTTIEGVRKLEEGGFRGIVMDAVAAAYEKNKVFK